MKNIEIREELDYHNNQNRVAMVILRKILSRKTEIPVFFNNLF